MTEEELQRRERKAIDEDDEEAQLLLREIRALREMLLGIGWDVDNAMRRNG